MLAATLGWSLMTSCVEGAASTPGEQMACCKKGHHTCPTQGSPEECCKRASQLTPMAHCTAVEKFSSPAPHLFVLHVLDPLLASAAVVWSPMPGAYDASPPPRSKHPTYLVLSTFRI